GDHLDRGDGAVAHDPQRALAHGHDRGDTRRRRGGDAGGGGARALGAAARVRAARPRPGRVRTVRSVRTRPENEGAVMTDTSAAGASRLGPHPPTGREAMYDVRLKTADAGADAAGLFEDDRPLGDIFAVPYAARHPDPAGVAESTDGRTIGYVV